MGGKLLGAAVLAASLACGSAAPSVIKTSSSPKSPAWLTRTPQEPGVLYFSGMREGAESLDDGKSAATDRAREEAAKYIGVAISGETSDVMSTDLASDQITNKLKTRTAALVRNATVVDTYWEKNSRVAGAGTIDRWDVSVLIKLSKAELDAERARQDKESRDTAVAALQRLREGQQLEKAGRSLAALVRYKEVLAQAKALGTTVETGDTSISNAAALRRAAEDAVASAQGKARRAILVAPDWIAGGVTQALAAKGFSANARPGLDEAAALAAARNEGLSYVIVVKPQATPGGHVFQQVAAQVALDVRALESQSGAVVASVQKTAKGFGRSPEAAQQAAAIEAGTGAGSDLATALVAKEASGN